MSLLRGPLSPEHLLPGRGAPLHHLWPALAACAAPLHAPHPSSFIGRRLEHLLEQLTGRPASILMYHGVLPREVSPPLWAQLPIDEFDAQMRFLAEHRPVVTLPQLVAALRGETTLEPGAVAITFDDGYWNVFAHALPVLARYRLPATLFVTMGYLERLELLWFDALYEAYAAELNAGDDISVYAQTRALKRLPDALRRQVLLKKLAQRGISTHIQPEHPRRLMTHDELKRLHDSGLFTLGAHTMTHGLLTRMPLHQASAEIEQSRDTLSSLLGQPVTLFAYPDGAHDHTVAAHVASLGFEAACSTRLGAVRPGDDLFRLHRYPVGRGMSLARFAHMLAGLDDILARLRAATAEGGAYG